MKKLTYPNLPLSLREGGKGIKAFTLVELIIVITILAILGTIAFVSFQGYLKGARDWNRLQTINNIEKWLTLYQISKGVYPLPEDGYATISVDGTELSYQWYFWEDNAKAANINILPVDPLDKEKYIYATDKSQNGYKILWYMEWAEYKQLAYNNIITQTYARDYTLRKPRVLWNWPWLLLKDDTTNTVVLENTDLFTTNSGTSYKIVVNETKTITWSWTEIGGTFQNLALNWYKWFSEPTKCSEWFIPVPGNEDFWQPGFCVAKYEMGYDDNLTIQTADANRSSVLYSTWKTIVSKPLKYPIATITQQQAITACNSIWNWYHLITNNEWMTIARNIEANKNNWSSWIVWNGWLYRWITNETNSGTSLGCATANSSWSHIKPYVSTSLSTDTTKWWSSKWSDCDSKRQHKLSNWEIIWDLAWNVWEHVNKANTIDWSNYANWTNWDPCSVTDGVYEWTACSDKKFWPSNTSWNSAQWMWKVWDYDWTIFLRGAGANRGADAGLFALGLDRAAGGQYRYVGFRCAF